MDHIASHKYFSQTQNPSIQQIVNRMFSADDTELLIYYDRYIWQQQNFSLAMISISMRQQWYQVTYYAIILNKSDKMRKTQVFTKNHSFCQNDTFFDASTSFQSYSTSASYCSEEFYDCWQNQNGFYSVSPHYPDLTITKNNTHKHKIQLCRVYKEYGFCQYGELCMFAHGIQELVQNHPEIKVRYCKNFYEKGYCKYGDRCNFRHDKPTGHQVLNSIVNKNISQTKTLKRLGKSSLQTEHPVELQNHRNIAKAYKKLRLQKILYEFPDILMPGLTASKQSKLSFVGQNQECYHNKQ